MNYHRVESEKTKTIQWENHVVYDDQDNCSAWPPLFPHFLFTSSLSYSRCLCPGLPFSQGNQWEPVRLWEQRHYSANSRKKTGTAELIESGRAKVSGSSRTEQQRMWLKGLNSSQSHTNTQRMAGLCVPFGPSYFFVKGGSSCQERTKHKQNIRQWAVNYICMFIPLCCGNPAEDQKSTSLEYVIKSGSVTASTSTFNAPISGPVKSKPHVLPDHKARTETSQSQLKRNQCCLCL